MNPWRSESGSGAIRGLTKTENHTYINTGGSTLCSTDVPDNDFLTDANVYYNLPPPLPSGHCRGASLPRGHHAAQPQITRGSSSCPASPKLPPAVTPRKSDSNNQVRGVKEAPPPPPKPPLAVMPKRSDGNQEKGGKEAASPPLKPRGAPKPRSKKLSHARSFDLDHIYQNLVKVASKPRSNSFSIELPWRRKKKVPDVTPEIKEDSGEDGVPWLTQNHIAPSSLSKEPSPRLSLKSRDCQTRCSSSSSSSSNDNTSENGSVADDCSTEVCPGVTYLKDPGHRNQVEGNSTKEEPAHLLYHSTATLPLHAGRVSNPTYSSQPCVDHRPFLDVNANLDEWLRKKRWLEKKRSSRNLRPTNESGDVDIAILHASDGFKWKNYLRDVFSQLVPKEDKSRSLRVDTKNVEEIDDDIGKLQEVKLKGAKLQIVIMSPCFLDHIAGHNKSELGQVFKPEKVLALLLGVDDSQLSMAHLSALYSYSDWHKLKVRNMDLKFVYEVLSEGINILNSCELYSRYQDESDAKFKITPRKVTGMQQQVYLMLKDPVNKKEDVKVMIEGPSKATVLVEKFRLRNPYTVDFRMPDEFLVGSTLLLVTVMVHKEVIGSRQLKCESTLDSMRALLATVSNPTYFMCQALNINPTSDELDQKLTETVKSHIPCNRLTEQRINKYSSEFPTWVHFSAYYGLERLTWALLEIPGGEAALNIPNCNGHTPSVLAYQKGFFLLAQTLEDAALVASLAANLNYAPLEYRSISPINGTEVSEGTYNSPPPPRPLAPYGYDPLPTPRELTPDKHIPTAAEVLENIRTSSLPAPSTPSPVLSFANGTKANSSSAMPPPPTPSLTARITQSPSNQKTDMNKAGKKGQDGRYLNMSVSEGCKHDKEYSEEVYTLVTAWLEKTNIKTFVEKHQEKIVEVKSKLDLNSSREESYLEAVANGAEAVSSAAAAAAAAAEVVSVSDAATPDMRKQENVVEQFFTLIRGRRKHSHHLDLEGARSPCDLPNDYIDDPTQGAMKEVSSDPEDESSVNHITMPKMTTKPNLQPSSSKSSYSGQKVLVRSPAATEEWLPEPPPRPDESDTYLQAEEINSPKVFEQEIVRRRSCSNRTSPRRHVATVARSKSDSRRPVTSSKSKESDELYIDLD